MTQEQQYEVWNQMSKKQLLHIAEQEASRLGIRGCNGRETKFEIMTFLMVCATKGLVEKCNA